MKQRLKAWQCHAEVCTHWRQGGYGGAANNRPGNRTQAHCLTCQIPRETRLSQSSVVHIIYTAILVWSVCHVQQQLRKVNRRAFITPDLWPPNSHYLNPVQNLEVQFTNKSIRQKCRMWVSWDSVWLMCGLEWNNATVSIDQWRFNWPVARRRCLHACIRASGNILNIRCDTN